MNLGELESFLAAQPRYPWRLRAGWKQWEQWISEMQPIERFSDQETCELGFPNVYAPFRPRPQLILDPDVAPMDFKPEFR